MSTGRRAGRIQRIAYDATPINSPVPDIDARIGWLLAMSRLHNPDETLLDGRRFVERLHEVGATGSRSLISRWESGEIPVSYEGMSGYEAALGLPPGQISSITGYVRLAMPGVKSRLVRPKLAPESREYADRLDALIDLAEAGEAKPKDWQELGWHLAAAPLVYLPGRVWQSLAHQIVNLLPRGVKVSYRQFSTAAMNLCTVPRAHDYLVDEIRDYIRVPEAQVLLNPIGLLDQLPTRAAAEVVLDLIEDPPTDSTFRSAVWLAAQKIRSKSFTNDERSRLDVLVLERWRHNPQRAADELAELIAVLPEGLRSTLTNAATQAGRRRLGYVVEHGEEMLASQAAGALAVDIAEAARQAAPQEPTYVPDRMLARLVREALFHRDSERRHLAGLLLSASPFGAGLTDQLLSMLTNGTVPPAVRLRAATLVRYLSEGTHRMRMVPLVTDSQEGVAVAISHALGHVPLAATSDQALRASLTGEYSPREVAKLYALGMTGSPGLAAIAGAAGTPEWQRGAARWWLDLGPAIHPEP